MSSFTDWQTTLRGNPPSKDHEIDPLAWVEGMIQLEAKLAGGIKTYQDDLVGLNSVTGSDNDLGFVLRDAVPANNGVYSHDGTSWIKLANLPKGFEEIVQNSLGNHLLAEMSEGQVKARLSQGVGQVQDVSLADLREAMGVASGATQNETDAHLKSRANHTGE
ncbi:hypothetical protein, partial [Shimia sp.]|uniref:hypothetical protein n=1 Tax=Shimia sp. TaxID=1954381 RepID=UPI003B8E772E